MRFRRKMTIRTDNPDAPPSSIHLSVNNLPESLHQLSPEAPPLPLPRSTFARRDTVKSPMTRLFNRGDTTASRFGCISRQDTRASAVQSPSKRIKIANDSSGGETPASAMSPTKSDMRTRSALCFGDEAEKLVNEQTESQGMFLDSYADREGF